MTSRTRRRPRPPTGIRPAELAEATAWLRSTEAPWRGELDLGPLTLAYQDPRALASTVELIFRDGVYDVDADEDSRDRILDGGGWLGLSVLRFRQLRPQAPIVVFEPDPEIFELMCLNLERNRVPAVDPVCAALGREDGRRPFHATGSDSGALTAVRKSVPRTVTVRRLGSYVEDPTALVKLNVEGAEHDVINELGGRLSRVAELLVEYHGFAELPQTLHEILTCLHRAGHTYVLSHFDERNPGCVPPLSLDERFRYFLLIYACHLRRDDLLKGSRP